MSTSVFRFDFTSEAEMQRAELTLRLAIVAAEGLFGASRVRMEVSYHADAPRSVILIDGSTPSGDSVIRIYTAFLTHEFGSDQFSVRRLMSPGNQTTTANPRAAA